MGVGGVEVRSALCVLHATWGGGLVKPGVLHAQAARRADPTTALRCPHAGSHQELLALGGRYAELWARQAHVDDLIDGGVEGRSSSSSRNGGGSNGGA